MKKPKIKVKKIEPKIKEIKKVLDSPHDLEEDIEESDLERFQEVTSSGKSATTSLNTRVVSTSAESPTRRVESEETEAPRVEYSSGRALYANTPTETSLRTQYQSQQPRLPQEMARSISPTLETRRVEATESISQQNPLRDNFAIQSEKYSADLHTQKKESRRRYPWEV